MTEYIKGCECSYCESLRKAGAKAKEVPTSRTLTREMLFRAGPCKDYRVLFIKRFVDSVEVTMDLALNQSQDWDWTWAAEELLSSEARIEFRRLYNAARKTYDDTVEPYLESYYQVADESWKLHDKTSVEARAAGKDCNEAWILADAARTEMMEIPCAVKKVVQDIAGRRLQTALAKAFVELFLNDQEAYEREHEHDSEFVDPYDAEGNETWPEYDYEDEDY